MGHWKKLAVATALLAGSMQGNAWAQETKTIRVGNWLPMHHLIVKGILEPWAEAIETETGGSLQFEIMESALGRPPAYFDMVLDGSIDVGYGVSGHNPGRFTMTQVMDLPFMSPDPWAGAAAAWSTYERYGDRYDEHEGAKVVGLWVHSEPYMFMREGQEVTALDELEGKKIRVGGDVTGEIVQALGGTPVQLPPTEAQQAMSRGVADGITFPTESIEFFKITPSVASATRFPGGLYTDTFWLAFNEDVWDGLSEEEKAAVEKHSGMAVAVLGGWAWTNGDDLGREALNANEMEWNTLPDEDMEKVKEELQTLEDRWLEEAESRDLPGEEILDYAKSMADRYRADKEVNVP